VANSGQRKLLFEHTLFGSNVDVLELAQFDSSLTHFFIPDYLAGNLSLSLSGEQALNPHHGNALFIYEMN
jgi:hypothetical protein